MPKLNKISIHQDGLVGTLYHPETSQKLPGLILLSGSDGGIPGTNAIPEAFIESLSRKGFAVLGLAYWGVDALPENLENIPLEYFENALHWLGSHPKVQENRVSIVGQSRGAELALLLGSIFPNHIRSIVASAPCSMICGGFPHPNRPAWLYQNKPIAPYLSGVSSDDSNLTEMDDLRIACEKHVIPHHANTQEDPYILTELFAARNSKKGADLAAIPVEKIKCPVLLLSGDQDAIWPAKSYCELIMNRFEKYRSPIIRKHLNYLEAGHGIIASYDGPIFHPKGQFWCRLGGTVSDNKMANEKSWIAISEFLQETLSKR
ncbi:MAG: hypothetical protein K2Y01_02135 [Rhabdochlamydiaceae bacterium]|nr:hypothetical protein [Rhabdochlamydiaceae bacterium]